MHTRVCVHSSRNANQNSAVVKPSAYQRNEGEDMNLPLETKLSIGIQAIHRSPPPGVAWNPSIAELRSAVERVDRNGFDSIWMGDHISFPLPILDPLLQIAQAAAVSSRL